MNAPHLRLVDPLGSPPPPPLFGGRGGRGGMRRGRHAAPRPPFTPAPVAPQSASTRPVVVHVHNAAPAASPAPQPAPAASPAPQPAPAGGAAARRAAFQQAMGRGVGGYLAGFPIAQQHAVMQHTPHIARHLANHGNAAAVAAINARAAQILANGGAGPRGGVPRKPRARRATPATPTPAASGGASAASRTTGAVSVSAPVPQGAPVTTPLPEPSPASGLTLPARDAGLQRAPDTRWLAPGGALGRRVPVHDAEGNPIQPAWMHRYMDVERRHLEERDRATPEELPALLERQKDEWADVAPRSDGSAEYNYWLTHHPHGATGAPSLEEAVRDPEDEAAHKQRVADAGRQARELREMRGEAEGGAGHGPEQDD